MERPKDYKFLEGGWLEPKGYCAVYTVNGNIIFPPFENDENEKNLLKKTISKCFLKGI